jgi:hypothetical protein
MRRRSPAAGLGLLLLGSAVAWPAAQQADIDIAARIREEARERSAIMRTLHVLTDLYGPRLTGSPNLQAAGDWAIKQMETWGLSNGRLEPWNWGRPGWVNERLSAHIVTPVRDQLVAEVVAWTPGTAGVVTARAFQLEWPERPTPAELNAYLETVKEKVGGRIVLAGRGVRVVVNFNPPSKRNDDETMRARFDPDRPAPARGRGRGGDARPAPMSASEISRRIDDFLVTNGALVRVNDAGREHGQIIAFDNRTWDVSRAVPTVVLRNEDYGRIARLLTDGLAVELEFDIANRLHEEGRTAYNATAEIEGSDKKDEVVMLGGHLDSWHSATGATDNAIGCAVMMEAVRILKALGVRPRRTIRVALWSGEEQGLLGSRAYVEQHFGSFENPKPEFAQLVAYLNIDNGTGRVRGADVFGPPEAAAVIRNAMKPFSDLGVVGALAVRSRAIGGTDSTAFNNAGLPGINFRQDPIEYDTHTHHTNLDTYERVVEEDAKSSASVIAAVLYDLAMREEPLPRFTRQAMPDTRR